MPSKYDQYSINDFVSDEFFLDWVANPTPESNKFWEQFLSQHPDKASDVAQAIAFINNLNFAQQPVTSQQVEASLQKNLQKIISTRTKSGSDLLDRARRTRRRMFRYVIATACVFLLALGTYQIWFKDPVKMQFITGTGERKKIILPDSSVVTLNENSVLSYKSLFSANSGREVWLEGEAFFEVTHKERKAEAPVKFIVHSGNLNVEVLGTTFNVKKNSTHTNVTLNTGKIRISVNNEPDASVIMSPGDFMQYSSGQRKIIKKQVKPELYSVWKEEKYVLNNITLREIAQFIEDSYGYKVEITDPELAQSRVSGSLRTTDEKTILTAIEFALDLQVVKEGNRLTFQPKHKTR